RKLFKAIKGSLYLDRFDGREESTVLLSGMGRSGTTWVSDVINHDRVYREVYEPFAPHRVKEARCFLPYQYVRPSEGSAELEEGAVRILSGKVRSLWVDKSNPSFIGNQRMVKDVRTNLMLGWLHELWPGMPIILLIRHPLAVVASWTKLKWGNIMGSEQTVFDAITGQDELLEDYPLIGEVMGKVDREELFEELVTVWCILNYVPLEQFKDGGICVANYDRLVADPEVEYRKVFEYLGKPWPGEAIAEVLDRPSKTNYQKKDFEGGAAKKGAGVCWRGGLEPGGGQLVSDEGVDRVAVGGRFDGFDRAEGPEVLLAVAAVGPLIGQASSRPDENAILGFFASLLVLMNRTLHFSRRPRRSGIDPLHHVPDLFFGQSIVFLRRHLIIGILPLDRFENEAFVRRPRHEGVGKFVAPFEKAFPRRQIQPAFDFLAGLTVATETFLRQDRFHLEREQTIRLRE
ncbi:MAG: sulfotransferase domain-containing protein, partial [Verrucomicrobiota bacterium]